MGVSRVIRRFIRFAVRGGRSVYKVSDNFDGTNVDGTKPRWRRRTKPGCQGADFTIIYLDEEPKYMETWATKSVKLRRSRTKSRAERGK